MGSRPVRVGNGAADQLQLDIYGEAIDAIYLADRHGFPLSHSGWTRLTESWTGVANLRGSEGTFSLCTFWYVDALARSGRLDEAQFTFEKMHTHANHLAPINAAISRSDQLRGAPPTADRTGDPSS